MNSLLSPFKGPMGEADHTFAEQPKKLFDEPRCPKTHLLFTAEDAPEEHCNAGATLLLNSAYSIGLVKHCKANL